jgi:hypothetical protein
MECKCEGCDEEATNEVITSCLSCEHVHKDFLCDKHLRDPGPLLGYVHACR